MLAVREDGKWAAFEYAEIVSRQNGKGSILEARVLAGLFVLNERLIMWSAHEVKTALEAFRRLRALLLVLGEEVDDTHIDIDGTIIKVTNTNGQEAFERLDTGQRVKFIARSKGSGRGFTGDVNIVDETFAYTDDQHSALMPTMSARSMETPGPQIIYTSSPPLSGTTGGVLYRLRKRAARGKASRLCFRDWGIEGDLEGSKKINLDDRDLWRKSNPAFGIRVSEEFIQAERESMSEEKFAIERLGIWPMQVEGGGAIDPGEWAAHFDKNSKRAEDSAVAVAVDIAPDRKYTAIGVYGMRADGCGHMKVVAYKPGTDWVLDAIEELRDAVNPVAIAMGRGTAASLEVELEKRGITRPEDPEKPKRGDLAVANATEMSAATGQFLDAIRQKTDRHAPDDANALDMSVAGAAAKQTGDQLAWARKESNADTAPLVTVTLARWAFHSLAHLVDQEDEGVELGFVFV